MPDAMELLHEVARTYEALRSLSVRFTVVTESGDEDQSERRVERGRAWFEAPGRTRLQLGGAKGTVMVYDGDELHTWFAGPRRYSKVALPSAELIPGVFRPEYGGSGGSAFRFGQIADHVRAAEIVRQEPPFAVVSVEYAMAPMGHFMAAHSPMTFWLDTRTKLVSRMEWWVSLRFPPHEEQERSSRTSVQFEEAEIDAAIPPETFAFAPPEGAIDMSDQRRAGGGMVSGWGGSGMRDDANGFRSQTSHRFEADTFVEECEIEFRGVKLDIERRYDLAAEGAELQLSERINGPKDVHEHVIVIPAK